MRCYVVFTAFLYLIQLVVTGTQAYLNVYCMLGVYIFAACDFTFPPHEKSSDTKKKKRNTIWVYSHKRINSGNSFFLRSPLLFFRLLATFNNRHGTGSIVTRSCFILNRNTTTTLPIYVRNELLSISRKRWWWRIRKPKIFATSFQCSVREFRCTPHQM